MKGMIKVLLITIGSVSVVLGVLGIFLPLLPTTPFLLLGAACYCKASKRLYDLLLNNKFLGQYIRDFHEGNGIPLRAKIVAISLLWITIGYSIFFVISVIVAKVLLFLIAVGVTIHLLSFKTLKNKSGEDLK